MSSELEELVKLPAESILYDMDFTKRMASGETISSISSSVFTNLGRVTGSSDITLGTPSYLGNKVQIRISDGTAEESYKVTITVTTSLGNTRIGNGLLRVE
jgi:hypothetical protein